MIPRQIAPAPLPRMLKNTPQLTEGENWRTRPTIERTPPTTGEDAEREREPHHQPGPGLRQLVATTPRSYPGDQGERSEEERDDDPGR